MPVKEEILEIIEKARQAQQEHEQKHEVQLEIPNWRDAEEDE